MAKVKTTPVTPAVTRLRITELRKRVNAAHWPAARAAAAKAAPIEPPDVTAARKLVARFDARHSTLTRKARERVKVRVATLNQLILFGDVGRALRQVEKLEEEAAHA